MKRENNEDSVLASEWLDLYLVADGMGGHSCGDVASQTCVDVIRQSLEGAKKSGRLDKKPSETFVDAIKLANTAVFELSANMPKCRGMGTTIAGVLVLDDTFITAHVGDSRVYRLRNGYLDQITTDHSLVAEQVALGLITPDQARDSNQKNIITRAMGLKEEVEVEVKEHEMMGGDVLLLCSDGLNDMASDEEILITFTEEHKAGGLQGAVGGLIELANVNGGKDNVTVILVEFKA